jgi:hypothetical protein
LTSNSHSGSVLSLTDDLGGSKMPRWPPAPEALCPARAAQKRAAASRREAEARQLRADADEYDRIYEEWLRAGAPPGPPMADEEAAEATA